MSDQSDALNKLARDRGIIPDIPPELEYLRAPRRGEQLISFSKKVGEILNMNGLYRRGATPVTIDPETGHVEAMQPDRFRSYLERHIVPYVKRRGEHDDESVLVPVVISSSEAKACLDCDEFRYPLRKLSRVNFVRLPVMRADGRIELLPKGYDPTSQILTTMDCLDYPTDWTLESAVRFLRLFFEEFPFIDERSLAVQICAMLTVYGADLLPLGAKRLNFAYRANRPRAGKGLLMSVAIVGPCGPFAQIQAIPDDKHELKKLLDTEALNGSRYVILDEVRNQLRDSTLNAFLTATIWTGRLFHSQRKFAVPQTSVLFIAGNNINLSADLAGRFLLVDLHVEEADAQRRKINHQIDEVHLARPDVRSDLLAATWALLSAWEKAGRPCASSVYRGFEWFSNIFGGIVENAGFGNPFTSSERHTDLEFDQMSALIEHLAAGVRSKREFKFHQIIEACRQLGAFEARTSRSARHETGEAQLRPADKSWFGKLLGDRYGATSFTLRDGRRARFDKRSFNRSRRYVLEIMS
ncbi:MAG TPA: hypothetical protein VF345_10890 [Chthoniobacterales bacterium]